MIRRIAAATLFAIFVFACFWQTPVQAQVQPTSTPRPTPTPLTPTATALTPTPVIPTATSVSPTATSVPPTTGGGGSTDPGEGSIRGKVYEDKNTDGKCATQNEPALTGIVIQFVSNDGQTTVFLESGADGSYGLVAAGLGTWKVSAIPPAGYSVSSAATVSAFISAENPVALGVDFCVRKGAAAAGPSVLPASGATIAPSILALTFTGLGFIAVGLSLQWRKREG